MTTTDRASLSTFMHRMPKCELHVHLEGTLEPRLARVLASRNNTPLHLPPDTPDHAYPFHDLPSFLTVYYAAMSVLITAQDFDDLATAYLAKAHGQNVRHAEMFFDPQAHTERGVAMADVVRGLKSAVVRARMELGMSASLIMCFLRDKSAESADRALSEVLELSEEERDVIVGVGLDSDEKDNPPNKFAAVFERVRKEVPHWRVTTHCDVDQVNSIEHIRQALQNIKVDRIDHGTNVIEDAELVDVCKRRKVGLTTCPISNNVILPGTFKKVEIMSLLRRDVLVTANSDDPAFFRGYVNESIDLLIDGTDITREEVIKLQENAFEIAWISDAEKQRLLKELHAFAAS